MQTTRAGHSATVLADSRVRVAGGFTGMAEYRFAERFDPATETFIAVASVQNEVRAMHGAHRLANGSVLLLGGADINLLATSTAESWQPDAGAAQLAAMPRTRIWHSTTMLADGRVLILGGEDHLHHFVADALLYE